MALLSGIRVIESATLLNGDTVGMLLGDMGADVVKIESPPAGDYLRYFLGQITPGNSVPHMQVNKNKRSVFVDLKSEAGLDLFWRLLDTADVFIDGNRPGVCDRLGIGYAEQKRRVPRIVYVQHTGFGATGPYAQVPTHGMMMGALVGAHPRRSAPTAWSTPARSTSTGRKMGGVSTSAGAVHAAMYACAALVQAKTTGAGARIDVAASDATLKTAWLPVALQRNHSRVTDWSGAAKRGGGELTAAKYQFYATSDARIVLFACIEPHFWDTFCTAIERPDLAGSGDGGNESADWGEDPALRHELQGIFATRTLEEWIQLGIDLRIPLSPAHQRLDDVAADPQIESREIFIEGEHPVAGPFSYVASPAVIDGQPYPMPRPAPAPGSTPTSRSPNSASKGAPRPAGPTAGPFPRSGGQGS